MDKDIRFTGYTATPSDYECSDGELTQCHNLINEEGACHSLLSPKVIANLGANFKVILIHKTGTHKRFIVLEHKQNAIFKLHYSQSDSDSLTGLTLLFTATAVMEEIIDIDAIGNMLILSTNIDNYYFIWRQNDYTFLGNNIPTLDIRFALHSKLELETTQTTYHAVTNTGEIQNNSTLFKKIYWQIPAGQTQAQYSVANDIKKNITYIINDDDTWNFNLGNLIKFKLQGTNASGASTTIFEWDNSKGSAVVGYKTVSFNATDNYYNVVLIAFVPDGGTYSRSNQGTLNFFKTENVQPAAYPENTKENFDLFMSVKNSFVTKHSLEKERFIFPFFVRYALRLFDGSIASVSAPILLVPNSGDVPIVEATNHTERSNDSQTIWAYALSSILQYKLDNSLEEQWQDIISGVVIYASQPLYAYNQGEEYSENELKFFRSDSGESYSFGDLYSSSHVLDPIYCRRAMGSSTSGSDYNAALVLGIYPPSSIASYTKAERQQHLEAVHSFYKISEMKFNKLTADNIQNGFQDLLIERGTLSSLVTRERLDDSYSDIQRRVNSNMQVYNNRLHVYNSQFKLPDPYAPAIQNTYVSASENLGLSEYRTFSRRRFYALVYIEKTEGTRTTIVNEITAEAAYTDNVIQWFYYPDANAKKVEIYQSQQTEGADGVLNETSDPQLICTINLKPHDFLNGAFYFSGSFSEGLPINYSDTTLDRNGNHINDIISKPASIYVSEVNNPFVFKLSSVVSVPVHHVFALSTAAKALSQGQFGQFPLYAFTDEGVWALETNSSGGYSAKQPITRDVCISSDSITQIDSAVLFATDRGIMEISGSTTTCITDIINGTSFFDIASLPGLPKLYPDGLPKIDCTFAEYRQGARMAYDYINQRIILFNATKNYAYVFSMRSKLWGIMSSSLIAAVNSYPDAYAMARLPQVGEDGLVVKNEQGNIVYDNCLVDLSRSDETHAAGLIVTRPIKLDAGSMFKTFDTVFLRGLFPKGKVKTVLYGSRDNISWHLIHSAKEHYLRGFRGSPYKYFRIVAITDLAVGETLLGASVSYTPRLTNQMR